MIFLFLLIPAVVQPAPQLICPCSSAFSCEPTAKISLYKKMKRVAHKTSNATIEVNVELQLSGLPQEALHDFDLFKNESSIVIDWLPFQHDVVVDKRSQPVYKAMDQVETDDGISLVATFIFDEINMILRSTYEIKIHSVYHSGCKSLFSLAAPVEMNITFACEKIQDAACTNAVKLDHHPVCNLAQSYQSKIQTVEGNRTAKVNISIVDDRLIHFEQGKHLILFYGACEEPTARALEPDCVISIRTAKRKRICLPFKNCTYDTHYNFSLPHLEQRRYGAQVCIVLDRRFELPPLVGRDGRIAADFVLEPPPISLLTSFQSPMVKTIVGYTLLASIVFMFALTICIYKCVTGRFKISTKIMYTDEWEIDEHHLNVSYDQKLGHGRFGAVYLAQIAQDFHSPANGPVVLDDHRRVAAKTCVYGDKVARKALFDEIEGTKLVGRNPRICSLLGVVHLEDSMIMAIEYCSNGSLCQYLSTRRKYIAELQAKGIDLNGSLVNLNDVDLDMVLSLQDLLRLCSQICAGMVYLSSQAIVHGSLCARHILVTLDHSIKLTDFGSAQKESSGVRFPRDEDMIKWTSLEVLKGEAATRKSDVWSFGIVIWEIITVGGIPYHNLASTAIQGVLEKGYRLQKPEGCSTALYDIMRESWHHFANQRPSFGQLAVRINALLQTEDAVSSRFIEVNSTCDYYTEEIPESRRTSKERSGSTEAVHKGKRSRQASVLLSESERLLGFRD